MLLFSSKKNILPTIKSDESYALTYYDAFIAQLIVNALKSFRVELHGKLIILCILQTRDSDLIFEDNNERAFEEALGNPPANDQSIFGVNFKRIKRQINKCKLNIF